MLLLLSFKLSHRNAEWTSSTPASYTTSAQETAEVIPDASRSYSKAGWVRNLSPSTVSPSVSIISNLSELLQENATETSSAAPWFTFAGSVGSLVEFVTLSLKPVM